MKNYAKIFSIVAAFVVGILTLAASPAHAETYGGVTCNPVTYSGNPYPADGAHLWDCTSAPPPNSQSVSTIFSAVVGNGSNTLNIVNNLLQPYGVIYYLFDGQYSAVAFFHAKYGNSTMNTYANSSSRCGNTGKMPSGPIISMAYSLCLYNGKAEPNTNIAKTILHETGHAADLAFLYRDKDGIRPSTATGFLSLVNTDIANLTPNGKNQGGITAWTKMTSAQKSAYVCNLFGDQTPSDIELSFGVPNDAVCSPSGSTEVINSNYVGKTPSQIAVIRAPYFIGTGITGASALFIEFFAEVFSEQYGIGDSGPQFLANTDRFINTQQFSCSGWVMYQWWHTLQSPPVAKGKFSGNVPTYVSGCQISPTTAPLQ